MKSKFVFSISLLLLFVSFCQAKGKKTFFVADRTVACAGTFECLQVREKAKDAWRPYADTIAGFDYQEGFEYQIQVLALETKNTMSGLYDEKYKLVKVISKKKTGYNPAAKLEGKKWVTASMDDTHRVLNMREAGIYAIFNTKEGRVTGKGVCNKFNAKFQATGSKISITELVSTKMMCKAEQFENIAFDFFRKAVTYKLEGNTLTLIQADGQNMVLEGNPLSE